MSRISGRRIAGIDAYRLGGSGLLAELLIHVGADEGDVGVLELEGAGLHEAEAAALGEAGLASSEIRRNRR